MSSQLLDSYVAEWQLWSDDQQVSEDLREKPRLIEPLSGLTNQSFLLDSNIGKLVIRINERKGVQLGINRQRELHILQALAEHHLTNTIAPKILFAESSFRYLIYFYAEGRVWTKDDLKTAKNTQRLKALIDSYQRLEFDFKPRSYEAYLQAYWNVIEERRLYSPELKKQWLDYLPKLTEIDSRNTTPVLCHHDLNPSNIIETDEGIKIIDWEYAHLGYPDLDWATVTEQNGTDTSELRDWLTRLWQIIR